MIRPGADPHAALAELVERIDRSTTDQELLDIGCGDLESLLIAHEELLWDEIEALARDNQRFRRALRSVWNYTSPMFEARDQLMFELGEWQRVAISLVGFNERLEGDQWSYRALEREAALSDGALVQILRRLADRIESPPGPPDS